MVAPLRSVLVRRPDSSFEIENPAAWGYASRPRLDLAQTEHDAFAAMLQDSGVEVHYHREPLAGRADAIFVHDPAIVTDRGAIILRMGKDLRRGEESAIGAALKRLDVPILATLRGNARAEGGDLVWVHDDVLAVGQGFRTNQLGLRQLQEALRELRVTTIPVPLPYFDGPAACLHLMSILSLVAEDLAVVYPRLLPVPLWEFLRKERFDLVEVPDAEFATMAPNVLAVRPRDCIMLEGNPSTKARLEGAGCRVREYRGNEISLKAAGGPTCLTRPILRKR